MNILDILPPPQPLRRSHRLAIRRELEGVVSSGSNRWLWGTHTTAGLGIVLALTGGATVAGAYAATHAGFLSSSGVPIAMPPPQRPEYLPAGTYDGRPLNIPSRPQASASDCPANPTWSPALPTGATVSVSLMPKGPEGIIAAGTNVSTAGYCSYTVHLPKGGSK